MNVSADFPFDPAKKIERGMRIAFRDPATDNIEVFEIRVVVNQEPDHFQQITAEHIALSELSDEHINTTEITDKTAAQALTTALTGTLWSVGTNTASGTQSADISRGSVWDAVNTIQTNWNVYITPRVVISSAGAITGRYLDIAPAQGVWRGLRFSVHKNMTDPAVTYNDEEVLTALYGYGGNVDVPQQEGDDETEELTFADVVWTATADHPAKPADQTYLEWPEKTALYGRNGRPRFGYYQNGNIKDAQILLEKTWEALKKTADPKISISGTVTDLYRLGYKDEPVRLHDLAIVEIEETGEVFQKDVIC
jgi:phage minor structural protein